MLLAPQLGCRGSGQRELREAVHQADDAVRVRVLAGPVGRAARGAGRGHVEGAREGHAAELTLASLRGAAMRFDGSPPSICHGDSGGPTLMDAGAGEEIAGVIARSDVSCSAWSESAILDEEVLAFIDGAIAELDPPAPDMAMATTSAEQGCALAGAASLPHSWRL